MHPTVDKVMEGSEPYKCPRCGTDLKCFFHERDSTSDSMDCTKCGWWAHTSIDGEWSVCGDPCDLYFAAPGVPLKLGVPPHIILQEMDEQWTDEDRMTFARALISNVENDELFLDIFDDRCRYCGKNLLALAGNDKRCYCQNDE